MTDPTSLVPLINQLRNGRVLCVGDVMLDRFTYGEVTRISAEAPIPVCRVVNETIMLGGAGNVVRNLDALGTETEFVTVVGADEAGRQVDEFLQALSAVKATLLTDGSRQTTIKDRFIAGVQQLLRVDRESTDPVDGGIAAWLDKKRRSYVDVVHGVSLDIRRGETLAIVGESGSGKTTLAMALCGLAPVLDGEIQFDGEVLSRSKDGYVQPDRRRIALMLQDPVGALSPRMTVRKLVAEPFRIHSGLSDDPDGSALEMLSLVGLSSDFADRYPHQLSGGQARRVGLARALAQKPDLLIADEPTAGLDVSIQGEVLNLLSELQQELGLGILIITHNLNIVRHVAQQMAIMYLGRFLEQGSSKRIFAQPRHPYTASLLAASPSTDPDAVPERIELTGEVPSLLQRPSGCEFHTRCPRVQADCRETFPSREGSGEEQAWNCFHPMPARTS